MRKLILILSMLITALLLGWLTKIWPENWDHGSFYVIMNLGEWFSLITLFIVIILDPLWSGLNYVRVKRLKNKNKILEEKTRHSKEMEKINVSKNEEKKEIK